MYILIFEIDLTGHHSIYLEKISEAYLELGHEVTVVVSAKYQTHEVLNRLSQQYSHAFSIVIMSEVECDLAMKSSLGDVGREIAIWRLFHKTYRVINTTKKVDLIFLTYADYCLNAIGLLGSPFENTQWSGICMRPTFHFKACGVIAPTPVMLHLKRLLFMRVIRLKTLLTLFTIDELLVGYIKDKRPALANKLCYLPDPADPPLSLDALALRQRYNLPQNAKVILIYGAIDERKGIYNLLDTLEASADLGKWHALVVGQQSDAVRAEFLTERWQGVKQAKRVHIMDTFVADIVEHHVLAMCDVVWVAYVGHYTMSGVVVRAGMYCKPVIACEEGLIGWYAREKSIGVLIKSVPLPVISKLTNRELSGLGVNGFNHFNCNTWSNFIKTLMKVIG